MERPLGKTWVTLLGRRWRSPLLKHRVLPTWGAIGMRAHWARKPYAQERFTRLLTHGVLDPLLCTTANKSLNIFSNMELLSAIGWIRRGAHSVYGAPFSF